MAAGEAASPQPQAIPVRCLCLPRCLCFKTAAHILTTAAECGNNSSTRSQCGSQCSSDESSTHTLCSEEKGGTTVHGAGV
eukprot:3135547-Pyramimonas_sp.AAC.2